MAPVGEASALIWADPNNVHSLSDVVAEAGDVEWVQLPYAGIEKFASSLDPRYTWTCGKGVYAEPVAEHIIALALAGLRHLHTYIGSHHWPDQRGENLLGAHVTVVGAGGITESLLRLLAPWNTVVTVVRRKPEPMPGAQRTVTFDDLHDVLGGADIVVIAAALTQETHDLVDARFLEAMKPTAWLINVARGGHVVTADLVAALADGVIAGAALDVTDPEPLPDGHPLWALHNCIITPHVANTPEMGLPLIAERVRVNVERWIADEELVGVVDIKAGY